MGERVEDPGPTDDEQRRTADDGVRAEQRDRTLTRLDAVEIKARLLEAFDEFVVMGYEAHLIGVTDPRRARVDYRIQLEPDGADTVPIRDIMGIADRHRLDLVVDKTLGLVLYPRW